jgi:tryptophanyl-tRNA synthetase
MSTAEVSPSTDKPETRRIITGFRPTSDLTVGNYLGAIKPVIDIHRDTQNEVYVFVADLHGLTDNNPKTIAPYRTEVIHDARALGLHQDRSKMFLQTDIEPEVVQIANRLAPYMSVAELARTPNLKEKLQAAVRKGEVDSDDPTKANLALLGYPVLMAADIFAQRAPYVAVGEDQEPHLELARTIARRFNREFDTDVLVEPQIFATNALRILSLDGRGKMSKTNPAQAIIFTDQPDDVRKKIKGATTAEVGEWNDVLESHFTVATEMTTDPAQLQRLAELRDAHMAGDRVMGEFKELWGDIMEVSLTNFAKHRAATMEKDVDWYRKIGTQAAQKNAREVLADMKEVMGF